MGCPELEVTELGEAACITQGATSACHGRASMTAEGILLSPAFKAITRIMHGYSSAAVATGNLARPSLSRSILDGRPSPPHTGAGRKGREQERQELIYLSQASVSLYTTHGS